MAKCKLCFKNDAVEGRRYCAACLKIIGPLDMVRLRRSQQAIFAESEIGDKAAYCDRSYGCGREFYE